MPANGAVPLLPLLSTELVLDFQTLSEHEQPLLVEALCNFEDGLIALTNFSKSSQPKEIPCFKPPSTLAI